MSADSKDNTKNQQTPTESDHDHGHVHGPHCNHGHERPDPLKNEGPKIGRNDPCICGSQKKYKKCCG